MSFKYTISKIKAEEYKKIPSLNITYGKAETKYGKCIMAVNNEGCLCFVYFSEDHDLAINNLRDTFPHANFFQNDQLIAEKTDYFETTASGDIKLLLKGTDFEMKVWEYLLQITRGTTTSYEEVAKGISNPRAVRAVANAVSKNNIAFFVPCHRVISKSGSLNKYKWGPELKRQILLEERAI